MLYSAIAAPVKVVVPATSNALKLFATPTPGRYGVRITNTGTTTIYVQERPSGDTAPTAAAVVTDYSLPLFQGQWIEMASKPDNAIYLAGSVAGTANIQEVGP